MQLEQRLEGLQHALRAERQLRDDEQADQAAMLKELQELIAREREQKEAFVRQVRPGSGRGRSDQAGLDQVGTGQAGLLHVV